MRPYTLVLLTALCGCGATENQAAATTETAPTATKADTGRPVELADLASGRWVSMPTAMTWYQAQEETPAGCHLPARWELTKGFDEGDFKKVNTTVWTASEINKDNVWRILMSNLLLYYPEHRASMVDKRGMDFVIYKCEE